MPVKPVVREGDDGLFRVFVGEEIYSDAYEERIFAEHIAERVVEVWGPALKERVRRKKRVGLYHWTNGERSGTIHSDSLNAAKQHVRALLRRKNLRGVTIELRD